jgi:alkylhydroperoxidase family enzyme
MIMHTRFSDAVAQLVSCVSGAPGALSPESRRAVRERAARLALGELQDTDARLPDVPDALCAYADTVARHAYRVTDEQVARLTRDGHSEDVLFEVTVSAAVGAGLARLERGLALLKGAR